MGWDARGWEQGWVQNSAEGQSNEPGLRLMREPTSQEGRMLVGGKEKSN